MSRIVRSLILACLLLAGTTPVLVAAGTLADPVDCQIENLSPSVAAGAQAGYVVHLFGGLGTYSVTLSYGDNVSESRSVAGASTSFSHWFASAGTYTQIATVSGAGSTATCSSTTTVY